MSNIVELPLPTRMITEEEVAKLHSNAFRDLETPIRDCLMMGKITEQLMSEADHGSHSELVFAMFHLSRMLDKLDLNYHAAWHGEPTCD
ncbi:MULTISPECIES: hypothetical protein [unclassified Bradyrhizobium]|uniref:hypothetical protein n=1 Tax=unclassified Bradyrhizobium TaxID=2631580 RepID=UPI0023AF2E3D|nr:hypothetical protein [Bradyrhizobium sp. CSS354]MDE5466322.1 hypothetical protein [Bradyrhizobium sp. CSS354]